MRSPRLSVLALTMTLLGVTCAFGDTPNLVRNAGFEQAGNSVSQAAEFVIKGDAGRKFAGTAYEFSTMGVALESGKDFDGDGKREGSVSQDVAVSPTHPGRWYRFQIRGLPEDGFVVANDDLHLKAEFLTAKSQTSLDGVTRKIYAQILQERQDLDTNGVRHRAGAATWKTYAFDFRLTFPEVDTLRLTVGFRGGSGKERGGSFFVDDWSLIAIPPPAGITDKTTTQSPAPLALDESKLIALGGRWFYQASAGETVAKGGIGLVVNEKNADRLFYKDGRSFSNPFAENMSAWLRAGFLDLNGDLVDQDQFRPDNVVLSFDGSSLIVRAKNLPNHPTAKFPSPRGSGDRNPGYIQEHDYTYRLPLNPLPNPDARAMDLNNSNRALPMGAIGFATNGVVFYNPFDAGMTDATDLMDRCCGHPSPDNRYHYHKYPICVKSPFADEGKGHSPVIGWAFDGFPIHGPYESSNLMAKDAKDNPLNAFNVHQDPERGWHYHVTPGQFPYIIGGYWGQMLTRNGDRGPRGMAAGRGPGPGGPPGGPGPRGAGPLLLLLDKDGDGRLSPAEIEEASRKLLTLDRNRDGELSLDEIRPAGLSNNPPEPRPMP